MPAVPEAPKTESLGILPSVLPEFPSFGWGPAHVRARKHRRHPAHDAEFGIMVILGIDPGTAATGYGIVARRGSDMAAVDGGVILTGPKQPLERRLVEIHDRARDLITEYRPRAVAVEDIYFGQNVRTAFAVGQARGVVLLAAGMQEVPCYAYTPQAVKLSVCGSGNAPKDQVQRMVQRLLRLTDPLETDHTSDALAVAICHASREPLMERGVG